VKIGFFGKMRFSPHLVRRFPYTEKGIKVAPLGTFWRGFWGRDEVFYFYLFFREFPIFLKRRMAILSGRVWGDDVRATFEGRVSSGMSIEAILPWEMRRISSFSGFRIGRRWSR